MGPDVEAAVKQLGPSNPVMIVEGPTGSGKSKVLPAMLASVQCPWMQTKLLVLTTAVLDVEDMHHRCELRSQYRHGGGRSAGVAGSKVVFESVGLAWKHFLADGLDFAKEYCMVLLDEAGDLEHDPIYSYLLELFLEIAKKRPLGIVLSSATLPPRLDEAFPTAPRVVCKERPHSLSLFRWQVEAETELYREAAALASRHLDTKQSVMVFLPGKAEIEHVRELLPGADVLHGELEAEQVAAVVKASSVPRIVLSTSIGEKGVTIPDIDVVIDVGFVRSKSDAIACLRDLCDVRASLSTTLQRAGRCGRTGPGIAYRLALPGEELSATDRLPNVESLASVIAVQEEWLTAVKVQHCRLLQKLPEGLEEELKQRFKALFPRGGALAFLRRLPMSVLELALLKAAEDLGVALEMTGLLSLVTSRRVLPNASTTTALEALSILRGEVPPPEGISDKGLRFARERCEEIRTRRKMTPSRYWGDYLEEAIAAAFLRVQPERLLWKRDGKAAYMGHSIDVTGDDGLYVLIDGYRRSGRAAMCTLAVPASAWALESSGVLPLTRTCSCVSDSTLWGFREAVNRSLRSKGIDLRSWVSKPGASEHEVTEALQEQPFCDLAIVVPNGNRLAKQELTREPYWLRSCCDLLASTIKGRAQKAVVFLGDAEHSPGVKNPAAYAAMVKLFREGLRERGLAVQGSLAEGITIADDGIHWTSSSAVGVERLISHLVDESRSTAGVRGQAREAEVWYWSYSQADGCHYPMCSCCEKRLCQAHLNSRKHSETFRGDAEAFADIRHLEAYSWAGRRFTRSDGSLRTDARISSSEAPLFAQALGEVLPPSWSVHVDPATGHLFYHHAVARQSQWIRPTVEPYDARELPPGWFMFLDWTTGKAFFYDAASMTSQWQAPLGAEHFEGLCCC